jgi:hypothetical protein
MMSISHIISINSVAASFTCLAQMSLFPIPRLLYLINYLQNHRRMISMFNIILPPLQREPVNNTSRVASDHRVMWLGTQHFCTKFPTHEDI